MFIRQTRDSQQLKRTIPLHIHIPDGCDSEHPCPVLYWHDGHMLFEDRPESDKPDSFRYKAYYEAYARFLPRVIIVGIEPPPGRWERTAELSPYTKSFETHGADFEPTVHGKGRQLLQWLIDELKPWIDQTYATRPEREYTAIGGYSSGALSASYSALTRPDVFSRLLLHGPAFNLWIDKLLETASTASLDSLIACYMDIGTEDCTRMSKKEDTMACALRMRQEFVDRGLPPDALRFVVIPGGEHAVTTWRWTFPDALRWIFRDL